MSWWGRAHSCWTGTNCLFSIVCNHAWLIMIVSFHYCFFNWGFPFTLHWESVLFASANSAFRADFQVKFLLCKGWSWGPVLYPLLGMGNYLGDLPSNTQDSGWNKTRQTYSPTSEPPQSLPKSYWRSLILKNEVASEKEQAKLKAMLCSGLGLQQWHVLKPKHPHAEDTQGLSWDAWCFLRCYGWIFSLSALQLL